MTPDQEIERLDAELKRLARDHPRKKGILRISRTAFGACTRKKHWEPHRWAITDDIVSKIVHGGDEERREALLSQLSDHNIREVEFVLGTDTIEVVPDE